MSIKIKLKIFPSREILCSSLSDFEAGESLIQSDVSCFQGRSSADLDRTERNRNGLSFEMKRTPPTATATEDDRINVCGASDQTNNVRGCESAHSIHAPLSKPLANNVLPQ